MNHLRSSSSSANYSKESPAFTSRYLYDFSPLNYLGGGSYGVVFTAQNNFDTKVYAVKRVGLSEQDGESEGTKVRSEVIALASLQHINVIRYFNAWIERPPDGWLAENDPLWNTYPHDKERFTPEQNSENVNLLYLPFHLYIQQELCSGGNLRDWMIHNKDRSEAMKLLLQTATGLEYVHSQKIIHRDLKPENILVSGNLGDAVDELTLKIADFGFASMQPQTRSETGEMSKMPDCEYSTEQQLTKDKGTELYRSPEQRTSQYDSKADMWALGIIAFELTDFCDSKDQIKRVVRLISSSRLFPEDFSDIHPFQHQLILSLLSQNPKERPTAADVVTQLKSHLHKTITLPLFHNVGEKKQVFPGRISELQTLEEKINQKEDTRAELISICGMGGVGKTELAKQFAYKAYEQLQWSVAWVHGDGDEAFRRSSVAFAQEYLNVNVASPNGKGILSLTEIYKLIHQTLKGNRWILIIDNVDQLVKGQDLHQVLTDFTKYPAPKPFVLITSRDSNLRPGITSLPLDILSDTEAHILVSDSLPSLPPEILEDNEVKTLCQVLQNFPLALTQAAAYIEAKNEDSLEYFTINNYLETYAKEQQDLLGFEIDNLKHDYALTTVTTWNTTLKLLKTTQGEVGNVAVEVLDLIAYCDSDDIPCDFILDTLSIAFYNEWTNYMFVSEDNVKKAIVLLKKFSLCKLSQAKTTISVHRLVQDIMRLKLRSQKSQDFVDGLVPLKKEDVWLRQILGVLQRWSTKTNGQPPRKDFLVHITQIWRHVEAHQGLVYKHGYFPSWIVGSLQNYHMYHAAFELSQKTYNFMRHLSVHKYPNDNYFMQCVFAIGNTYGRSLWTLGRNEDYQSLLKDLFTEEQATLTMKHPMPIHTGFNFLRMQTRSEDLDHLELARTLRDNSAEVNGEQHETTIELDNFLLAETCRNVADLEKGWEMYMAIQHKVEKDTKHLTPERVTTTMSLIRMLKMSNSENTWAVSDTLEELVKDLVVQYGEESNLTQQARLFLAEEFYEQGKQQEGLEIFHHVVQVQKRTLGEDHPVTKFTISRFLRCNPAMCYMANFANFLVKNNLKLQENSDPIETKKLLDQFQLSLSSNNST